MNFRGYGDGKALGEAGGCAANGGGSLLSLGRSSIK